MNKFRPEMTPSEQRDFLTHTRLYLSKDVKRTVWGRDSYVLKHTPTGRKLRVSAEQLFILGQFGRGTTVAELVPSLIMNRRCLPLKEVYELVLMARDANILNEVRDEEFAVDYSPDWWPSISANVAQFLWGLSVLSALVIFIYWSWVVGITELDPTKVMADFGWAEAVLALPVLSIIASMGGLLASAYAHRLGVDIRRPRIILKSLVPRIAFDWSDIDMAGADAQVIVAKLRMVPAVIAATFCTIVPSLHPWAPLAIGVMIWRAAPLPGGAVTQWISSFGRRLLLSVERPVWFYHHSKKFSVHVLSEFRASDWSFAGILVAWSLIWMAMIYWMVGIFTLGSPYALFQAMKGESVNLVFQVGIVVAAMVAVVFVAFLIAGWYAERADEKTYGRVPKPLPEGGIEAEQVIEDCPLFREIPVEVRADLKAMARTIHVRSGQQVVGIGEKGEDFYIIASGSATLSVQRPRGKQDYVATLVRGDSFGEFSFFGPLFRTQNMRAETDLVLIALSSPELESLLKRHLSVPFIEEVVQRRTFLMRIGLSSGWENGSILRFAKVARFEDQKEGQTVIGTGRENRFFYLVYDGAMEVRQHGRRRARILSGAFFGEISLLLNNQATADIVAELPTRCLVLQKSDFLNLMGNDIELALQLESIASDRLGRPLFPFQGTSMEALAN